MVSYTPPRACSKMRMKSGMPVGMGSSGGVNANRLGPSRVVLDRVMRHDHIHSIDTTRRTETSRGDKVEGLRCRFLPFCSVPPLLGSVSIWGRFWGAAGPACGSSKRKRHINCFSGKVDAVVSNISDNKDGSKVCNPLFWGLVTGRFGRKEFLLMTQLLCPPVFVMVDTDGAVH